MTAKQNATEEQMITLVRNALLVAGQEMGAEGDHWPVINSTIHSIAKDWEDVKIERDVFEEIKKQFVVTLRDLRALIDECPAEFKPRVQAIVNRLTDIYAAAFAPVTARAENVEPPVHIQRAEAIFKTLEGNHE